MAKRISTNLGNFEKELDNFIEVEVPKAHLKLQQKIAIAVLTGIVNRTPVGNPDAFWETPPSSDYAPGRAKGGWRVGINVDPSSSDDVRIDPSGSVTISEGLAQIALATPFSIIQIYNNVPYIIQLEYGWSRQAPNGMVRLSVSEAEQVRK